MISETNEQKRIQKRESIDGITTIETHKLENVEVQTGSTKTEQKLQSVAREMTDDDHANQFEPAHSLLLSSLRFWEVERDLIEERIAALRALTVPS